MSDLATKEIDSQAEARCLDCGYSLRGIESKRCPECGRTFDLKDISTFDSKLRRRMIRRLKLAPLPIVAWIFTMLVGNPTYNQFRYRYGYGFWLGLGDREFWVLGVLSILAMVVRWIVRQIIGERDPTERKSEKRFALATLFFCACTVFLPIGSWSCPHGSVWAAGKIGIARSETGGPCRNARPHLQSWHISGNWYFWID